MSALLALRVTSDALIALACFSIPLCLVRLVRARSDLPFLNALRMFSAFIIAGGITQLASIVVVWYPIYWVEVWLKAGTAALSIVTVITLVKLLPRILAFRSTSQLEQANLTLEAAARTSAGALQSMTLAAEKLHADSVTDTLTNLANRRGFDARFIEALANCRREAKQTSLMMIDIDNFKAFNDAYGHPAGDQCLRMTADAVRAAVRRPRDFIARFGGEELAIIMEDTTSQGAQLLAERVRQIIANASVPQGRGALHAIVTVSIGVATTVVGDDMTPEILLLLADQALYRAKAGGKNCVMAWGITAAIAPGLSRTNIELMRRTSVMSNSELDELPFGAIVIEPTGTILRYNQFEANLARIDARRAIGKNFFNDIAPRTGVSGFEGRLRTFAASNDRMSETFDYRFAFTHGTQDVAITFMKMPAGDSILIAVEREVTDAQLREQTVL